MVGYARVSTRRQAEEGYGLDAQMANLVAWGVAPGDVRVERGRSAKAVKGRPGLEGLLDALGPGDVLVVAKLDRLTRSLQDFAAIVADAQARGWRLVVNDGSFDLDTVTGRAMAGMMAVFGQMERELISVRTSEGIAERRAAGTCGRDVPDDLRNSWVEAFRAGESISGIARRWTHHRTTVARVLRAELGVARGPLRRAVA